MSSLFSFGISCLALLVSGITAWLTFFRKGELVMTQPTVVFFGPDGSRFDSDKNKIYLRTLLYSTAKRGQVTIDDPAHSASEYRFVDIGTSASELILAVA